MDKQMQAFALGGLKDEGGEIDEASGNRVPIGGTKEGVRDDIPANVSEGEFIFPADVVRYHGLDKMMALRQEAKMGLKQMERMGQMGNSEEATMPDDLPFGMADLIVVGGEGEPMEFAEGGFVPQMQTLQTAPVPTMGGGTSTGTQTPIVYDDFMKTPVVTMQEYRDANGNSIIITSVNGKATTEIPAGYTLYVPPTNAAPTATQAAIQTANNYSYQTSGGGDEGPDTPRELQVDPDYASMDNATYFSTMERQNSFGGKAGNAAAMGIALAMGPLGLLTMGMLQADKRRQLAAAEQRIAAETNPTKKKAYQATFAKMGGKTKEPEEENALVKFGKGFVAAVSGMFGLGNNDVEKVASVAASAAADNTNVVSAEKQAPAATPLQVEGMGSPLSPVGDPLVVGAGPTALPMNTFKDKPFGIKPDINLAQLAGIAPASDRTRDILNRQLETGQFVERLMPPAPPTGTSDVIDPKNISLENYVAQPLPTTKDKVVPKTPPSSFQIIPPTQSLYTGVKEQKTVVPDISESASDPVPVPKDDTFPVTSQVASSSPESIQTNTQPVAQTDMQMGIDPKNIYPTEEQIKLRGSVYNTNAQYRQMMGDASDPRHRAERMSEVFVPDTLSQMRGPYKNMTSFLGKEYPISTLAAMDAAEYGTFQPDYTTGTQTDAALSPQTDAGALDDMIAGAPVRTSAFETGQPAVRTAGLIPDWAKNAYSTQSSAYEDRAKEEAAKILENNAVALDPNAVVPRADPVAPASTGYGNLIPSERTSDFRGSMDVKNYRGSAFPNLADTRQGIPINYVEPVSQPSLAPMATSPSFGTRQRAVGEGFDQTDPRETINPNPMNDSRQAFADNRVYSSPREEADKRGLSESQLTLGRARNASTMPDPYVASLNSAFGRSSVKDQTANAFSTATGTVGGYDEVGTIIDNIDIKAPELSTTPTGTAVLDDELPSAAAVQSVKNIKAKTKPSDAARTSKGTSTRKAAPTGDDRRSEPNFLERAFGIEPAKISARRGNDGVLYRTQADKREADNRQLQSEQVRMGGERYNAIKNRPAGQTAEQARLEYNARPENAKYISTKHGGDKEPSSKIVCSAMNNAYGFGSFRNKIWLEHSKNNLTKEHQVGYHRMFLPLIHLGYNKDYKFIRKCLEHIARHRTADIYFQSKSNKRDTLGMVYRTILEPICYLVGMFPTSKDNK